MSKTISFHNGTQWSRGHNIRDKRYTSKQEHIDSSLTKNNVVLCDIPIRQAYSGIFDAALQEYNSKQKRKDRKIDDYYLKIKNDKRKHVAYECIVQIGDCHDTGNNAVVEKEALKRFVLSWEERNPNLKLIGAYIHCDEPEGTVHAHIDYIPVANCNRGMSLQNSFDRALQQQGFKSENIHKTAQVAWQNSEREVLLNICKELGIDAQLNQNITKGRSHLDTPEYKEVQSNLAEIRLELSKNEDLKTKIANINKYEIKHNIIGGNYIKFESESDAKNFKNLAKKGVLSQKNQNYQKENEKLKSEIKEKDELIESYKNKEKNQQYLKFKEMRKPLSNKDMQIQELKKENSHLLAFIEEHGLSDEWNKDINQQKKHEFER